ncbi:uncharacterized protein LOC133533703 [Cydia pomonella]|uniref:uncharacterized protein LOC133533703 n=1 Tax=Cydia pomonella TaxID=82600 RepID=UPI002ADDCF6F|nr:uncharacterized protein LOC133533703 [Cydia pomonella]
MTSMLFGAASSPFLAHSVRNRNAMDNADEFPDAVEDITRNHYMDDYVASYPDEKELLHRATQVASSHAKGGFQLRGWTSNSVKLLQQIPTELHASTPAQLGKGKENKILGMYWNPETDQLGFNTTMIRVPAEVKEMIQTPTKRQMLSAVMSVYDPLGLLSHYTITAKVQLQNLWAKKLDWDSPLPEEDKRDFEAWLRALDSVAKLRIPRCYLSTGAVARRELHVFVDASTKAYACVAYWRVASNGGEAQVSLIAAKSKVGPTRQLSIPRMELQSALIGSRLQQTIREEHRLTPDQVIKWTEICRAMCGHAASSPRCTQDRMVEYDRLTCKPEEACSGGPSQSWLSYRCNRSSRRSVSGGRLYIIHGSDYP